MKRFIILAITTVALLGAVTACQTHDQAIHSDAVEQGKLIYGE